MDTYETKSQHPFLFKLKVSVNCKAGSAVKCWFYIKKKTVNFGLNVYFLGSKMLKYTKLTSCARVLSFFTVLGLYNFG